MGRLAETLLGGIVFCALIGCSSRSPVGTTRPHPKSTGRPAPTTDAPPASTSDETEELSVEYHLLDRHLVYDDDPYWLHFMPRLHVEVVIHSEPPQRMRLGPFEHESCAVWNPSPAAPTLSSLECVQGGPYTKIELIRGSGDRVMVVAASGARGKDPPPMQRSKVGTFRVRRGRTISSTVVDGDAQRRRSEAKPIVIRFARGPRGWELTIEEPSQRIDLPGWSDEGCELVPTDGSQARVAFIACPVDLNTTRESLLLAYVGPQEAALWAVESATYGSSEGPSRELGRIRIPRTGPLRVQFASR